MSDFSASNTKMSAKVSSRVAFVTIDATAVGQRIDNFLFGYLKKVPKSRIYRALRKGEVRVNKKRAKAVYKLALGDCVRIPPLQGDEPPVTIAPSESLVELIESRILFENDQFLVINKPSGIAVHGGSGIKLGLIESLRGMRSQCRYLELAHRLDRETSGCLLVAKKRTVLLDFHRQLKLSGMQKHYSALLYGRWKGREHLVNAPLKKNTLASGERLVRVSDEGKASETLFYVEKRFKHASLVCAQPITGRTHQIRVHAQFSGHPIMGDQRYSAVESKSKAKEIGLNRLFLHARFLAFNLPGSERVFRIEAPLDEELTNALKVLEEMD